MGRLANNTQSRKQVSYTPIQAISPKVSQKPCQKVAAPAIAAHANRIPVKISTPSDFVSSTFLD